MDTSRIMSARARQHYYRLVMTHGRDRVATALGVSKHALAAAVAGFEIQHAMKSHAEQQLERIEAELSARAEKPASMFASEAR